MSDTPELDPDLITPFFKVAKVLSYGYVAAITVVIHDAILLFRKEVKHIYSGRWSLVRVIYILIRLLAVVDFALFLYTMQNTNVTTQNHCVAKGWAPRCKAVTWVTGFTRHIAYTCVIKTLLVMRLRALYGNENVKVSIILAVAMAVELASAAFIFLLVCISTQIYGTVVVPFPGCIIATPEHLLNLTNQASNAVWASRLFSNTVEVVLTLGKLYHSLMTAEGEFLSGLERMKHWRPIFYVFYRDGMLFFIPMFILSTLALLDSLRVIQTTTSWTMWLSLVYCTCGTRLILNLRIANCKLTSSTIGQQITTIQFYPDNSSQSSYQSSQTITESKVERA
ncbi:hypothetical protein P691DRAFT_757608 [Macrolepiota fuliginosa MF-IS2]|uniref:DUF6533 domain-containing protein n=1 Tax=Macrolepiota fuliginosa MF-IS2 TaxID=1400762 RepID=A0A9P6C3V9_9AGAR|nr:hypothetical protein P691DRAFT_757608 [Macrolepiota fuliginosa MF-IS2]